MDSEFCAHIIDQLSVWNVVTARKMFGGYGLYRDRQIFAIIADDVLYLKVDDENRAEFERAQSTPFQYEKNGKQYQMSYWQAPDEALDHPTLLADWAETAWQAALRSAKK